MLVCFLPLYTIVSNFLSKCTQFRLLQTLYQVLVSMYTSRSTTCQPFLNQPTQCYFQIALRTELDHNKVEDGCRKLKEHLHNHPVIQSCCSIPLNAAILAHLFLTEQSLPSTRHELFLMLVLSRINRELQERYPYGNVTVLSLDNLPHKHKIVLRHILCTSI